jgi:hypothetical protein
MRTKLAALVALIAVPAFAQTQLAQSSGCRNTPVAAAPGNPGVVATMSVPRNGQCSFYAGSALAGMQVVTPPRNGRVEIVQNAALYTANQGFSGSDVFVVSGTRAGTRLEATINVEVR